MVNLLLVLVRMLMLLSPKNLRRRRRLLRRRLLRGRRFLPRRFVYSAFIFKSVLTLPYIDRFNIYMTMRWNCYPVCLCADNMSFSYLTPLSIPLTGRRIQQRYMSSFLHLFEVYSVFDISILASQLERIIPILPMS